MIFLLSLLLGLWLVANLYLNHSAEVQLQNGWHEASLTAGEFQRLIGFFGGIHASEFLIILTLLSSAVFCVRRQFHTDTFTKSTSTFMVPLLTIFFTLLIVLGCLLYLVALSFSWTVLFLRGNFLSIQDFTLVHYFRDTENIQPMFSSGELYLLAQCLGFPTVIFLALLIFTWFSYQPIVKEMRVLLPVAFSITLVAGWQAIPPSEQPNKRYDAARFMKVVSTPTLAFWSEFIFRNELREDIPIIDVATLHTSYSLETYKQMIPAEYTPTQNILLVVVEALQNEVLADPTIAMLFPEMSRLKSEGVYFSRSFAQANDTEYSMRTILTGLHPLKFVRRDLNFDTDYPFFRIYDLLALGGYRTGLFAAEWMVSKRLTRSDLLDVHFDPQFENEPSQEQLQQAIGPDTQEIGALSTLDERVVEAFLEWSSEAPQKFFGILYLYSPHFPYTVPKQYSLEENGIDSAVETSFFGRTTPEIALARKERFYRCIQFVDQLIRSIRADLRSAGLEDSTTIIITGDHGQAFGEHGAFGHSGPLFEITLRVPILIWNPPTSLTALPETTPAGHIDLAPTILQLAGLPQTNAFQGISLFLDRQKSNELVPSNRALYSTVQMLSMQDAIISWPYKLTVDNKLRSFTLYDLERDPHEEHVLTTEHSISLQALRQQLEQFRATQLGYYALPRQQRANYFAPPIPTAGVDIDRSVEARPPR